MARKLQVHYPGAAHHVFARADRREALFADEEDRCYLGSPESVQAWRPRRAMPTLCHLSTRAFLFSAKETVNFSPGPAMHRRQPLSDLAPNWTYSELIGVIRG